jgi:hypothetical protein
LFCSTTGVDGTPKSGAGTKFELNKTKKCNEKRTNAPSRSNYIILSIHCTSRLNALGVFPILLKNKKIGLVNSAMNISPNQKETKAYKCGPEPKAIYYKNTVQEIIGRDWEDGCSDDGS